MYGHGMVRGALRHGLSVDDGAAERMWAFVEDAYPWFRSITGDGVRRTLQRASEIALIEQVEVATGTPVLDWTVPQEWVVRDAHVVGPDGRRLFDVHDHNLHLVGYSTPFQGTVGLDELTEHLHTLPDHPDLIPNRSSFYAPRWGFCAAQREVDALEPGDYEVVIDTELVDGSLTYGEIVLPGEQPDEVLISTHVDHPSLANDNLSGIAVAAEVARALAGVDHRLTYRFVFVPSVIGAITWLARNSEAVARVRAGLVITGLGDAGTFTYKRSRRGGTVIDRVAELVVAPTPGATLLDWYPFGYDERQYCSPGFDLAVGRLTRSLHGTFPEYHTSGDDLSFVDPGRMVASADLLLEVLATLDANGTYVNLRPHGEPRLGPHGLLGSLGGGVAPADYEQALFWVLSLSDGTHDLVEIAQRSGLGMAAIVEAADRLLAAGLLAEA